MRSSLFRVLRSVQSLSIRACPERTILHGSTKCDENTEEYRSGVDRFLLFLGFPAHACPFGYAPDVTAKAQHRHCFRLMDLKLNSVGTRKCTGRNVIRLER